VPHSQVTRIHHIGFVVDNLDETLRVWENVFGVKAEIKENPDLQVRLGSIVIGGVKLVFNASTAPGSRWDAFLRAHGEGVEHIALEVTDIDGVCRAAKSVDVGVRFSAHKPMYDTISNFLEKDGMHAATVEVMQPVAPSN
jgi:methylmalonyl-CoA/ethylmalonyl-CoA epimerase